MADGVNNICAYITVVDQTVLLLNIVLRLNFEQIYRMDLYTN